MQNSTQINTQRAGIDKEILALRAKSIFFKVINSTGNEFQMH